MNTVAINTNLDSLDTESESTSFSPRIKERLESTLLFLKNLKLLLENDSALQEYYKNRNTPHARLKSDEKIHSILEKISLRVQRIRLFRGDPRVDIEYAEIDRLHKEIDDFRVYGLDFDIIRLFVPPKRQITKKEAQSIAKSTFHSIKPILLEKKI